MVAMNIYFEARTNNGIIIREEVTGTRNDVLKTERGAINRLSDRIKRLGYGKDVTIDGLVKQNILKYVLFEFDSHDVYNKGKSKVLHREGNIRASFEY